MLPLVHHTLRLYAGSISANTSEITLVAPPLRRPRKLLFQKQFVIGTIIYYGCLTIRHKPLLLRAPLKLAFYFPSHHRGILLLVVLVFFSLNIILHSRVLSSDLPSPTIADHRMAPAMSEAASLIGIANVSSSFAFTTLYENNSWKYR